MALDNAGLGRCIFEHLPTYYQGFVEVPWVKHAALSVCRGWLSSLRFSAGCCVITTGNRQWPLCESIWSRLSRSLKANPKLRIYIYHMYIYTNLWLLFWKNKEHKLQNSEKVETFKWLKISKKFRSLNLRPCGQSLLSHSHVVLRQASRIVRGSVARRNYNRSCDFWPICASSVFANKTLLANSHWNKWLAVMFSHGMWCEWWGAAWFPHFHNRSCKVMFLLNFSGPNLVIQSWNWCIVSTVLREELQTLVCMVAIDSNLYNCSGHLGCLHGVLVMIRIHQISGKEVASLDEHGVRQVTETHGNSVIALKRHLRTICDAA